MKERKRICFSKVMPGSTATWKVQSLCDEVLYSTDNNICISATCKLLKAQILAFRVVAHTETAAPCTNSSTMHYSGFEVYGVG